MFQKLAWTIFIACALACIPGSVKADYFYSYIMTALDSTKGTVTLSDGSQWTINEFNLPNVQYKKMPWQQGNSLFMVPIFQPGGYGSNNGITAVLLYGMFNSSAHATMVSGSTILFLKTLDQTTGIAELSDGSTWTLDPQYSKNFATWQIGDPITPAGYRTQKYLINGNNRTVNGTSCMSFSNARTSKPRFFSVRNCHFRE